MKILSTEQIRQADEYTIKNNPISSVDLMERAALNAFKWILKKFENCRNFTVFAGPGNNGGDGLVIARYLYLSGKKVEIFIVDFTDKYSEDFKINYQRIVNLKLKVFHIKKIEDFPELLPHSIIIDCIFGSGHSRPAEGLAAEIITKINETEKKSVVSIDIPSGLFGEENFHKGKQTIIKADYTLTFEFPFLSFYFAENESFIGQFIVIPIGLNKNFTNNLECDYNTLELSDISKLLKPREKFSHKGTFGHGLLIAGSYGKMGASILAARAAHRAGIGLLTVHIPKKCVDIIQISSPESLTSIDNDENISTNVENPEKFDSIGIGPAIGLNENTTELIDSLFKNANEKNFVIDADAITLIAQNLHLLEILPQNAIFTPHPKELERLIGKQENEYQRLIKQIEFSKKYNAVVVQKGANTKISTPQGKIFFNTTGNPGMATGGSGDVLTGIILALLSQGYSAGDSAKIGVFIHGLAADLKTAAICEISLTPSDIIENLGKAFNLLKC